jgi:hypothetical protein
VSRKTDATGFRVTRLAKAGTITFKGEVAVFETWPG